MVLAAYSIFQASISLLQAVTTNSLGVCFLRLAAHILSFCLCLAFKAYSLSKNFRDIARNVEENKILHKIFRVGFRFPSYISCYITGLLRQCT